MLFFVPSYRNMFMPVEFVDPFGSPVFAPRRKKLKGYQKNQIKAKKHR